MSRVCLVCAIVFLLGAGACTPWTVRPIEAESAPAAERPVRYVDSIWNSKLLPAVLNGAVEARTLLDALVKSPADALTRFGHREANGPSYLLVKGEGVVTKVDTQSRVGLALIDVAPYDGKPDLSIQIGPVLRGTSLRDATGVNSFRGKKVSFAGSAAAVPAKETLFPLSVAGSIPLKTVFSRRSFSSLATSANCNWLTKSVNRMTPVASRSDVPRNTGPI